MNIQAFVDDSRSDSGDREFALAGYMTVAPQWIKFSNEWSNVLAASPSIDYFHAVEAQNRKDQFKGWEETERDEKVMRLAGVIERHPLFSFDCRMSVASFERILLPVSPYDLRSPYFALFHAVVTTAARQLHMNQVDLPIDFIFDEQGNIGAEAALWYGPMRAMLPKHLRPLLGNRPIFRSDKDVVPLQAADALAWHLRRSREQRYQHERRPALDLLRKDEHVEARISDEILVSWARQFSLVPGIKSTLTKADSVKEVMLMVDNKIEKMPKEERIKAYEEFNDAMDKLSKVRPETKK
jgi:hypothetical protein